MPNSIHDINTRKISVRMPSQRIETRLMKESVNLEARTARMVFSSEKPVRTFRWKGWDIEEFNEILSMDPKHMRRSRLDKGAVPLLNSHRRYDLKDQLGTVVDAEFKNKQLEGEVKFSKRKDVQEIFDDVADGVVTNGSLGYRVYKYQDETKDDDKVKTLRAIDWELIEMSLVPVGADENAGSFNGKRADGTDELVDLNDCEIILREENERCESILRTETPSQGETMKDKTVPVGSENTESATQAQLEAARQEAAIQERTRVSEIHEVARAAKLEDSVVQKFIAEGKSVDAVRKFAIDELAKKDQPDTRSQVAVEVTRDEKITVREGMAEALQVRAQHKGAVLTEKGRRFRGMKLLEMARFCAGMERDYSASADEIIRRAMTTSDFPLILADTMNKELQREYKEKEQSFKPLVRPTSLSDFRAKTVLKLGDFPQLKKKNQLGEIEKGSISEGKESYKLDSYAREVMVSREIIINDDLDFISRLPTMAGRRARQLESDLVWALITGNPTMTNGNKLFSAGNANIVGANVPVVAEISKLIALLRLQKGLDGGHIDLSPAWLVGPTALEATFATLVNQSYVPTKASDINPWNKILKGYIVDSRMDAHSTTKWYLTADVSEIDMIELATLDGQGPQTNTEEIFGTGMKLKILHDVGAGLIDHRGFTGNGVFA